jgi:hypothetical protein
LKVVTDLILRRAIRHDADEAVAEVPAEIAVERRDAAVGQPQQYPVVGSAAERQQAGLPQIVQIDQYAGAEAERAFAPSGLRRNHAPYRERLSADQDRVADLEVELREQLRSDERAVMLDERV